MPRSLDSCCFRNKNLKNKLISESCFKKEKREQHIIEKPWGNQLKKIVKKFW